MAIATVDHNGKSSTPIADTGRVINIKPLAITRFAMRIRGTSPLIVDCFSQEAKELIARGQTDAPKDKKKPPRDPEAEYKRSIYVRPDGRYGFPKLGIRKAVAVAASRMSEKHATDLLAAFLVDSVDDLLVLEADEPTMRFDHTVQRGVGAVRYRAQFWPWAIEVPVKLHEPVVGLSEFIDIVNKAGIGVGLGNWRPEKKGDFGTFEVVEVVAR